MAFLECDGTRIWYEVSGKNTGPVLVFSNSLGTSLEMWDAQATALSTVFRIVRYDTRGHGRSDAPVGPYTIEELAGDLLALLGHLKIDRFNFCGLSMGGMIGMWLGLHAANQVERLVLCNTSPKIGVPEMWNGRIATVRRSGMEAIADAVLERWYTTEFRAKDHSAVAATRAMLTGTPVEGYAGCCAAIRDTDLRDQLAEIAAPALIVAGSHDPVTTPADGHFLAERLRGSKYLELPAAHLSNIEASGAFTMGLSAFLKR